MTWAWRGKIYEENPAPNFKVRDMWLDPWDKVNGPVASSEFEEPEPDPRMYPDEVFASEMAMGGRETLPHPGMRLYTGVCSFDESGNHTQMANDCPHFNTEDEMGMVIRDGWTAQHA